MKDVARNKTRFSREDPDIFERVAAIEDVRVERYRPCDDGWNQR